MSEERKTTENTPLPDLLEAAAKELREHPDMSLDWGLYDGTMRPTAYPAEGVVYMAVSERQMFHMDAGIAARIGMQLLMAAGHVLAVAAGDTKKGDAPLAPPPTGDGNG